LLLLLLLLLLLPLLLQLSQLLLMLMLQEGCQLPKLQLQLQQHRWLCPHCLAVQ
jgi:hypothetical protein